MGILPPTPALYVRHSTYSKGRLFSKKLKDGALFGIEEGR